MPNCSPSTRRPAGRAHVFIASTVFATTNALAGPQADRVPSAAAETAPSVAAAPVAPPPVARVSLADAVARALARNTTLQVALEEVQRVEALVREARAASLPTLSANATYTRLDADRVFGTNVTAARDQLAANLLLTVPLIVPQRWGQWSHASANARAQRANGEDVRRQVAMTSARAYLAVVSQGRVVDVNQRALAAALAHYEFALMRFKGGVGNRLDAIRAEQETATDRAQLEQAYAGLSRAREALGIALGEDGPLDASPDVQLAAPPSLGVAIDEARTRRQDVLASKERWDAAERVRQDAYLDYLPFLVGTLQPFYQNPPALAQPTTGWQAQLLLTVPLYDGGLRYGLSDERTSFSREARAQFEGLTRQAVSDARVAFDTVKRTETALVAANNAARLAQESLELATTAYRAGATTNLEVIDAERRARDAETAGAIAEDNARQARLDLLAASGRFP